MEPAKSSGLSSSIAQAAASSKPPALPEAPWPGARRAAASKEAQGEMSGPISFGSIVGRRAPPLAFRHGKNFAVHAGVWQISKCEKIRQD
jgi:hypothetical protein